MTQTQTKPRKRGRSKDDDEVFARDGAQTLVVSRTEPVSLPIESVPLDQRHYGHGLGKKQVGDRANVKLSVHDLKKVVYLKVAEGGFQRDLIARKVKDIAETFQQGFTDYPSIMLFDLGDGNLYSGDGQHRAEGFIFTCDKLNYLNPDTPVCHAEIVKIDTLDRARAAFCINNATTTRATVDALIAASNSTAARTMVGIANAYNAHLSHVRRFINGFVQKTSTNNAGYYKPNAVLPVNVEQVTRTVFEVWSADPRWQTSAFPTEKRGSTTRGMGKRCVKKTKDAFSLPGTFQALGIFLSGKVINEAQTRRLLKRIVEDFNFKSKSVRDNAASGSPSHAKKIAALMASTITKIFAAQSA